MFFRILLNQARHRWGVTLLVFLAMASLVALYVYVRNTATFSNRSMQLVMKNMGHNMLILPEEADPLDVHLCSDAQTLFADDVTHNLARRTSLASRYYVSMLQKRLEVRGREYILTGIEPVRRPDETREKSNPITPVAPGTARLGASAAAGLETAAGTTITVLGTSYDVAEVLPPKGTEDDFRIYLPLPECQRLLGEEGRINAILAFMCLSHGGTLADVEDYQRRELARVQPGFKHLSKTDIAQGRYLARTTTQRYLYYLLALVAAVTVLVIAITGIQEVSERRRELGILVAMGTGYTYIVGLYLTKTVGIALAASLAGFASGSWLAVWLTSPFLMVGTRAVRVVWSDLPPVMALACLVALTAMMLPMVYLVRMDPNETLYEK
jgi:putative ABC transport system permease protein